jgi:hypothetical protein
MSMYFPENRIPHTTLIINRDDWQYNYKNQLRDMYKITRRIILSQYPKIKIDWDSRESCNSFATLIFSCSSKYISKYSDDSDD